MRDQEISPVILGIIVVIAVVIVGFFTFRATEAPTPDPSSYTPGVPPWMDTKHHVPGEPIQGMIPPGGAPGTVVGGPNAVNPKFVPVAPPTNAKATNTKRVPGMPPAQAETSSGASGAQ